MATLPFEENEKLLKLIEERPVLWDKKHDLHYQFTYLREMWEEIAEEMDLTVQEVKRRWKNLRDGMRLSVIRERRKPGCAPTFMYYENCKFVKDHIGGRLPYPIKKRRKKGNQDQEPINEKLKLKKEKPSPSPKNIKKEYKNESNNTTDNEIEESYDFENELTYLEDMEDNLEDDSQNVETLYYDESESPNIRDKKLHDNETLQKNNNIIYRQNNFDENMSFFQSLIPHMEKMEPEQKLLCRIELQKVVYKFAYATKGELT